jgi:hypothetical protein
MHRVVMQPMSSHLKKNLGDDNEPGASHLVIIFSIWGKKPRDNDKLGGTSSSSTPKKLTKKWWQVSRPTIIATLDFF